MTKTTPTQSQSSEPGVIYWPSPKPFPNEFGEDGTVQMDRWKSIGRRTRFELGVCGAFDPVFNPGPRVVRRLVDLGPGETIDLPRCYREAIRTTRDGQIIGGLGPHLELVGEAITPLMGPVLAASSAPATRALPPVLAPSPHADGATSSDERLLARARAARGTR